MVDIRFYERFTVTRKNLQTVFYFITDFISLDLSFFISISLDMSTYYFECLTFIYVLKYISAFVYNVCHFTFFSFVYGRSDTASALGRPIFLKFLSLLLFSFLFCVRQCLINTVFFLGRDDRWLRGARECLLLVLSLIHISEPTRPY